MCKYKRSVVTMISFILLIACAPASDANEVIRTVESPRLVVGSRITMSCTYLGSCPDPCNWVEVIWEKIGQSGSVMTRRNESSARGDDDRWSVATEFPKTTLAITKVNASDSGSYQCCFLMRSNPEKRVEAQLPLTIVTSSFLEMFDEDVYLTVGEEDPVLPTVVDCIDTTDIRKKVTTVTPPEPIPAAPRGSVTEEYGARATLSVCLGLMAVVVIASACGTAWLLYKRRKGPLVDITYI